MPTRHMFAVRVFLVFVLILNTHAFSAEKGSEVEGGTWFYSMDNDIFSGSDDEYTNGFQFGWVSGYLNDYNEAPLPEFLADTFNALSFLNGANRQRFISYSGSHRIFTPGDIETTEPIEGDLPYSGLLFGTLTAGAQDADRMDALSIHLGIVGPSARGDEVQNEFHKLIGSSPVNGWDNQLRDEILYNVNYEYRSRLSKFQLTDSVNGDVIFQAGGAVGNLVTMATVGLGGRIGWGVQDDFMIPPQFFGEETIGSRPYNDRVNDSRFYFFGLFNASAFSQAIFWDGNTSKDSLSVDYSSVIRRLYLGVVYGEKDWSLSFSIANTTVPWETPTDRDNQSYGKITLAVTY